MVKLYVCAFGDDTAYFEEVVASDNRGQAATGVPGHVMDWARDKAKADQWKLFRVGTFTPPVLTKSGLRQAGRITWLFDSETDLTGTVSER